nr:precorrin-3B synthase [Rhizobium sp. SSA_523]
MARGACPALDAPMLTGDGYLSRLALTEALSPLQLAALCDLAERHGNGMIDISARGNLQIRGLTPGSAAALETDVRDLGLPLREGLAVEWSPLAGRDQTLDVDPRPLGQDIMALARRLDGALAPKLSVVIESGGLLRLDDLLADIRLVATKDEASGGETGWTILLGGTVKEGRPLGFVTAIEAADCVVALLSHFAALGPRTRGRDIDPAALPDDVRRHLRKGPPLAMARHANAFGALPLRNGSSVLRIALPFGQIKSGPLAALVQAAEACRIDAIRPAPEHSLLCFGPEEGCRSLQSAARQLGFIVEEDDPLRFIHACSGRPACRSGWIETHALARLAADTAGALLDGSVRLHVSGCPKGCAHPMAATLTFAGTQDATHLVIDGKTTDTPAKRLAPRTEVAALAAIAALLCLERRNGETSRDCLQRLGPERIAAALA